MPMFPPLVLRLIGRYDMADFLCLSEHVNDLNDTDQMGTHLLWWWEILAQMVAHFRVSWKSPAQMAAHLRGTLEVTVQMVARLR